MDNLLTKVRIKMILPIRKLTSFNKPEVHKKEKIHLSTIHQQYARTQAICIVNDLIQQEDLGTISASNDDPISEFNGSFDQLNFEQG